MSPMIDIQRRHAEVFRIRLGEKGPNGFPQSLTDAIRVTAPNEGVCHAFTAVYGGEVKPWKDGGRNEFEAYLPTTSLSILVLPGQSLQQWWEKYKRSVCVSRCDGEKDTKTKKACTCPPDIDDRMADKNACKPMTRVNVLCPDVAVVGSGALVTHSLIAAETLPQSIAVAEAALSRGLMVPARLRVVEHKGLTHYIVPQIEIVGISLSELVGAGEASALASVTDAPSLSAVPSWKPVGELPAAPFVSIADQLSEVATPQPKPARRNAAQVLPSTGLAPRTAVQASQEAAPMLTAAKAKQRLMEACDGDKAAASEAWGDRGSSPISEHDLTALIDALPVTAEIVAEASAPVPRVADTESVPDDVDASPPAAGAGNRGPAPAAAVPKQMTKLLFVLLSKHDIGDDERHGWASDVLGREVASFSELTADDTKALIDRLEAA